MGLTTGLTTAACSGQCSAGIGTVLWKNIYFWEWIKRKKIRETVFTLHEYVIFYYRIAFGIVSILNVAKHIHFYLNRLYNYDSGNYCPIGSAAMVQCPAGTVGLTTGLSTMACSSQCTAGM